MNEFKEKLVLVVEDDQEQSKGMMTALAEAGLVSIGVPGIREALFKLKNQAFSCVVLDLLLGNESGIELVDLMRTRLAAQHGATPILLISANLDKGTLQRLAGKIQGAMVKPLEMKAFVAHVRRLVGDKR